MTSKEHAKDCPCDQIIDRLVMKLNMSRDRREQQIIKGILLSCGVISISNNNKNSRTYAVKK